MRKTLSRWAMTALALSALSTGAAANLVQNGDFSAYSSGANGPGQLGTYTTVDSWTNSTSGNPNTGGGYSLNFLFDAVGDAPGTWFPSDNDYLRLWGPANGSNNGLSLPPSGSNYLAMDGDQSFNGAVSQEITGLTVGLQYTLTFNWAAAQQYRFNGDVTEKFQVTFGTETQETETLAIPSNGFSGWRDATMTFTAMSETQVLSFLSIGTPGGGPPFALLADVTLTAVPEPSTVVLLGVGLVGIGVARRFRGRVVA